jgi:hypothetical protein
MRKILATLLFVMSAFSYAQINVVPVNGGTGSLVSVPIPGGSGLSVTVGTGSAALPLQEIKNNPNAVNITTHDDWYNQVPLGFDFPFYGRIFNNSWAMTNGLVTFVDPQVSGLGGACCSGIDLRTTTDPRYNYTIYGMHTDLYSWNGQNQYYLRGTNEMTYGWYNMSQCCSSEGGNSFEIKINSAGLVDTRIAGARVQWNMVTSGMAGDLSKGEYYQAYHGQGLNITPGSTNIFSWQALGGTGAVDMCTINPLSSPACPGYQAAYTIQQCTISALYDPSCPGYQQAYQTQQCSINPLFSTVCPGYQYAYLQQQCSLNSLYSTTCPGYQQAYETQQCSLNSLYSINCPGYANAYLNQQCSLNPLYSTTCSGYAEAYKTQQCTANPLYATDCPGYAVAYKSQQCSINALYATDCPGYDVAYKAQQCSISSLYATDCPGYAVAYKAQQCSISALYATDCPGYAQAYFSQQCTLNGLYDRTCPNYSTAYATKMLLERQGTAEIVATAGVVARTAPEPTTSSTGETKIALVADSNVNSVITTTATSASPAQSATATVPLAPMASASPPPPAPPPQERKSEGNDKQGGEKPTGGSSQTAQGDQGNSKSNDSSKPTARQEIQAKRQEAARAKAVESGKQLANEMGKSASMEQQVAVQNVVIQAMGYSPAFEAYKVSIPDVPGYKPYSIYKNQSNVDNRFIGRRLFGGTDQLHNEMVNSQYK